MNVISLRRVWEVDRDEAAVTLIPGVSFGGDDLPDLGGETEPLDVVPPALPDGIIACVPCPL